jgi:hypothetical protein
LTPIPPRSGPTEIPGGLLHWMEIRHWTWGSVRSSPEQERGVWRGALGDLAEHQAQHFKWSLSCAKRRKHSEAMGRGKVGPGRPSASTPIQENRVAGWATGGSSQTPCALKHGRLGCWRRARVRKNRPQDRCKTLRSKH